MRTDDQPTDDPVTKTCLCPNCGRSHRVAVRPVIVRDLDRLLEAWNRATELDEAAGLSRPR